jgi:predicted aconitase with swiveling domain
MSTTFKGRVVLSGNVSGNATVSRQAFNTSGSYQENMFALFGKDLSGAILCTTTTVGSTMGGMCLMGMKAIGVGPQALLFSKPIDTLAAAGVLMSDIWKDARIITVDMLGDEFLETVNMGDPIEVREDGTVVVG